MPKRGVEEEEVSDGDGKKEESEGRKERGLVKRRGGGSEVGD